DGLDVDANRFIATSAQSVLEALPFLLRDDRTAGVDLTFEIRLTGSGGACCAGEPAAHTTTSMPADRAGTLWWCDLVCAALERTRPDRGALAW
ncbi:MAG TPA: hypothetical protein PKA05_08825, partial [Roseiflexaceae bacterium]|nr:hypothetical protein [Roseiflexaceae bacterium]